MSAVLLAKYFTINTEAKDEAKVELSRIFLLLKYSCF